MKSNHDQAPLPKRELPIVRDWHRPRDPRCAQNNDLEADCTCTRQRTRKPYRVVRVHDATERTGGMRYNPKLVLSIWPNGVIKIREHGCRQEYTLTAGSIFLRARYAEAMRKISEKTRTKKAKPKARPQRVQRR